MELFLAIGLMSGTSMDGIDIALIETDGKQYVKPLEGGYYPYTANFRDRLRHCIGKLSGAEDFEVALIERELTELHAIAVLEFLGEIGRERKEIDIIGFHGHTIWHRPEERITIQIGDGDYLARRTGIPVVNDFRSADVKAGGQGAPLVPLYHYAISSNLEKPLAIINIGGISNITYIPSDREEDILAFDAGPGNAMIDDWMRDKTGLPYDDKGQMARKGRVDENLLKKFLSHLYFSKKPPKSLDRNIFHGFFPEEANPADGAATITMMSAASIATGFRFFDEKPKSIYLTGGGRKNLTMKNWLERLVNIPTYSAEDAGWNGDSMEAEAFAYLAVRSILCLPISMPGTTGVKEPMTGGILHGSFSASHRDLLQRALV